MPFSSRKIAGVDEREREPVVEPCLRGEGEAHLVALVALVLLLGLDVGATHLHVPGQHRVRRGEHRAQQQGRRGGQPEAPPAQEPDRCDAQRHRREQQSPGRRPATPVAGVSQPQRAVQRQADTHEGQEYGELGHLLDQSCGWSTGSKKSSSAHRQQTHGHAGRQQHHGRRDRQPAQDRREQGREQDGKTCHEIQGAGHRRPPSRRAVDEFDQRPAVGPGEWAQQGSNLRPPRCKRGALPLSYTPRTRRAPPDTYPGHARTDYGSASIEHQNPEMRRSRGLKMQVAPLASRVTSGATRTRVHDEVPLLQ